MPQDIQHLIKMTFIAFALSCAAALAGIFASGYYTGILM